jgi:Protein of unknown function (DUF 659)
MPNNPLSNVSEHFKLLPGKAGRKTLDAKCRHCDWKQAANVTRQQGHLVNCKAYHAWKIVEDEKKTQKKRPWTTQDEDSEDEPIKKRPWDYLSVEEAIELDDAATLMIIESGLPFSFLEKDTVKMFLKKLRPAYKPPSAKTIATTLLDRVYKRTKDKVDDIIRKEQYVNLSLDGSDNVSHDRVTNISIGTKRGCFYYHNVTVGETTTDATYNCEQIMSWVKDITDNKPEKINSISLDTCSTQFATFRKVAEQIPRCFMINCTPHGLNLLAGDIIKSQWYLPIHEQVSAITSHMNSTNKQYQIFKTYQAKWSEKQRALATSGKTRWNSNLIKYDRIRENGTALQAWKQDSRIQKQIHEAYTHRDGSQRLRLVDKTLDDPVFQSHLAELAGLIRPIDKAMVATQGDDCHVGKVLPLWKAIFEELQVKARGTIADWDRLWPVLNARWDRQLNDVHLLAWYLLPQTILDGNRIDPKDVPRLFKCLQDHIHQDDFAAAKLSFLEFVQQRGAFHSDSEIWLYKDEQTFWLNAGIFAVELARFCDRLWNTLATEASSERAFSMMKLTHSSLRNRTTAERVDKQLFVQINYRVLNRIRKPKAREHHDTDDNDD